MYKRIAPPMTKWSVKTNALIKKGRDGYYCTEWHYAIDGRRACACGHKGGLTFVYSKVNCADCIAFVETYNIERTNGPPKGENIEYTDFLTAQIRFIARQRSHKT